MIEKKDTHTQRKNIGKSSKGMAEKDLAKIFTVVSYQVISVRVDENFQRE